MRSISVSIPGVGQTERSRTSAYLSSRQAYLSAGLAALVSDLLAFSTVLGMLYLTSVLTLVEGPLVMLVMSSLGPLVFLGLLVTRMYNPLFAHPAHEIKVSFLVVGIIGITGCALLAAYGGSPAVIWHVAFASGLLLFVLPLIRGISRIYLGSTNWWGMPVVVFATGEEGSRAIRLLKRWPELGLRPVALVREKSDGIVPNQDLTVLHGYDQAAPFARQHSIGCAIVACPDMDHHKLGHLLDQQGKYFRHMMVVPRAGLSQCMWSTTKSYDGMVGFAVQHYSWRKDILKVKAFVEQIVAAVGLVILAPFMMGIALWIKLDSEGPVFFTQERMGRQGRCFKVFKFRTMYQDAENRLEQLLEEDERLREEYWLYHKLENDPRVTTVGSFLRRFSIDELPQLINVLRGEMSLVGPRAYMPGELSKMNGLARAVLQSPPGLTGLWQVSGRNLLSFEERVDLDVHYLQNWSPWLDIYILLRTIPVVTSGKGAR